MTALLHDVGKARVPAEILNKTGGLEEREWKFIQQHPWMGALTLFGMRAYEEIPVSVHPGGARAPHEDGPHRAIPRRSALARWACSPGSCRWPTDSMPPPPGGCTPPQPIEPDQVLKEMWENPKRGYDRVVVKALINLIGIYPVGTCVILDTLEVAIVAAPNPDAPAAEPPAGAHRRGRGRRHRAAAGQSGEPHGKGRERRLQAIHRKGHQP